MGQNAVLELELAMRATARRDTSEIKGASSGALDGFGAASDGGLLGFSVDLAGESN
jgi:hypothetical protein